MILYLDTERDGVPVIAESGDPAMFPGARKASDAEYAAYLAYWNEVCTGCGRERGDHSGAMEGCSDAT